MTAEKSTPISMKASLGISLIALILAIIALWKVFKTTEQYHVPDILILQASILDGDLSSNKDNFTLTGSILLQNQGNSIAEIRDAYWQTSDVRISDEIKNSATFLVSDTNELSLSLDVSKYSGHKLAGLENATIDRGEKKVIYFYLQTQKLDTNGIFIIDNPTLDDIYYPYFVIIFQHGQQVIATPTLK